MYAFGILEKWLLLGLGREIFNMSLEHRVVSESNEGKNKRTHDVKETQESTERAPNDQSWNHLSRQNKVVLDNNPECKTSSHESILI